MTIIFEIIDKNGDMKNELPTPSPSFLKEKNFFPPLETVIKIT
jgi:hypothetical protein